ncbi:MAG: leucine-rich repeat protein [Verrucomicrobiae bacterium]|nr:leucine-rich repeat protein [Verrucomicrobiae bacterium]
MRRGHLSLNSLIFGFDRCPCGPFAHCTGLTQITIPNSLTTIESYAFYSCTGLTYARFAGNAPATVGDGFFGPVLPTVLYLPGTSGWSDTFGGAPTALWLPALGRPWSLDIFGMHSSDCFTPTGYRPPAQGWRPTPTLGKDEIDALNPNGVAS